MTVGVNQDYQIDYLVIFVEHTLECVMFGVGVGQPEVGLDQKPVWCGCSDPAFGFRIVSGGFMTEGHDYVIADFCPVSLLLEAVF